MFRSYRSAPPALANLNAYRDALSAYSDDELEDVYFHIDVFREPTRYELVQSEMGRRGLLVETAGADQRELGPWIDRLPGVCTMPTARYAYLTLALFVVTSITMFGMLATIWLFAVPWRFTGIQASLVYLILAPIVPLTGLWFGIRAGGWRLRSLVVPAAIVLSLWLFTRTGCIEAILHPIFQAGGGSGGLMSGW